MEWDEVGVYTDGREDEDLGLPLSAATTPVTGPCTAFPPII